MLNVVDDRTLAFRSSGVGEAISGTSASARSLLVVPILMCMLPFIQLGLTYWISIEGLAFVLALFAVDKRLSVADMSSCALITAAMLVGLILQPDIVSPISAFKHNVSQAIGIFIIVCAAKDTKWNVSQTPLWRLLIVTVVGLVILTLAQYVTYVFLKDPRFLLPASLYVTGQGTLARSAIEFGRVHGFLAAVRVAATFAEPSYLGFISMCLTVMVLNSRLRSAAKFGLLTLLLAMVAMSKSASGIIMITVLIAYAYRSKFTFATFLICVSVTVVFFASTMMLLDFDPIGRLLSSTDPRLEQSGYIRLIMPLQHAATVLKEAPFGVPFSETYEFLAHHSTSYTMMNPTYSYTGDWIGQDNGLLNLIIQFGWAGFIVIGGVAFAVRDGFILLFLLFATQFNGSALTPDKVAMISLALAWKRGDVADRIRDTRPG